MVKSEKLRFLFTALFFLIVVGGCGTPDNGKVLAGPAPDFMLHDLAGKSFALKEIKGHVVIVDFWATWCGPCVMSIPELVDLQKKYRPKGLVVIGISVDDDRVSKADLVAFTKKMRMNYRVFRANNKIYEDYFGKTSGFSIPTLFVIDREGKVRDRVVGFSPGVVEKSIQKLL